MGGNRRADSVTNVPARVVRHSTTRTATPSGIVIDFASDPEFFSGKDIVESDTVLVQNLGASSVFVVMDLEALDALTPATPGARVAAGGDASFNVALNKIGIRGANQDFLLTVFRRI